MVKIWLNKGIIRKTEGAAFMLTVEQIRAARALLDWSQSDLADRAGLSQTGIARIENGTNQPNSKTLAKIQAAFDGADIEFMGTSGLRKRTGEIKVLRGQDGFKTFMDDVYDTVKNGAQICVSNVDEKKWIKWMGGQEKYDAHAKRMRGLGNKVNARIISLEGDNFFIADSFAEYRWVPANLFGAQPFYSYGSKLALIKFEEDDVYIMLLNQPEFVQGYNVLFNIAWDYVAKPPLKAAATG